MKNVLGLVSGLLLLVYAVPAMAQETSYCYQILVDGKDRSRYQYVDNQLLFFSDPLWSDDPKYEKVLLSDVRTGKPERSPQVLLANPPFPQSRPPWRGIYFPHLAAGKRLTLEVAGKKLTFERTSQKQGCPRMDFLLDSRWEGYEVLRYDPYRPIRAGGVLSSYLRVIGDQVLLKIGQSIFKDPKTLIFRQRASPEPYAIKRLSGAEMLRTYPDLSAEITKQWGINSSYLFFAPLRPGEEIKITGMSWSLAGDTELSFFVRRIPEGGRGE
ncbi:MAG: hypothetical protein L0387_17510 [Acidobacteria bacterium]|nr:hypothetical protein [Acidobacteriota bacterium]MCI0721330.1 hypothetical protein [Acidobacteriota bacterium]